MILPISFHGNGPREAREGGGWEEVVGEGGLCSGGGRLLEGLCGGGGWVVAAPNTEA